MENIPKIIYLNIGEELSEVEDFNDLEGVTWSKDGIYMDIPYCSISIVKKAFDTGRNKSSSFNEWFKKMELGNE